MTKYEPIVEQAHRFYEPGVPYEIPLADSSIFDLLEGTASRYPNLAAIDYFGQTLSYSQVLDQTLRAAQVLVDAGVKRGDTVALALPNCPQAFVAFYACQRIGAVAAQHNPLATVKELKEQVERHQAKVAIAWEPTVTNLPPTGSSSLETVFSVDLTAQMPVKNRLLLALPVRAARQQRQVLRSVVPASVKSWDRAVKSSAALPAATPGADVDDVAVILHTGGTNGVPKSVPLTHKNLGTNVDQCLFWVFKLHEGAEVFYSLLPYFHAFGLTFFLLAAVKKAATQVVLPKFDVDLALEAHRRRPVTFFVGVPPMFERIAKGAQETRTDISSIRFGVSGAMPLPQSVADLWERTAGGVILEGYGLSETSPVLTGSPLSPNRRLGTLGLPFPSTRVRLVDLDDPTQDVEDGSPGEIIVKGPQVFSGYLGAADETEKVFTEEGWFRTGDIAINDGGYLYLVDRRKELILSGGFNVYPSQVEEVIRAYPSVKDVAVIGLPDSDAAEVVTAALVMEEGAPQPSLQQIRAWSKDKLSGYAIPKKLEFIEDLPRNPLGKVLRRAVKEQLLDPVAKAFGQASRTVSDFVEQAGEAAQAVLPSTRAAETEEGADKMEQNEPYRAALYDQIGGPEVLYVGQSDRKDPGPGEVIVRVQAAGINPYDAKVRSGVVGSKASFPRGIGSDFTGIVEVVGDGATYWDGTAVNVGDEVLGAASSSVAEVARAKAARITRRPEELEPEVAGALNVPGLTAVSCLTSVPVGPEDTLLVGGATGAVGLIVSQLALARGAKVIGTAGEKNHELLRSLGVIPVTYGPGLVERLEELPAPTAVVDCHGREALDAGLALGVGTDRMTAIAAYEALEELGVANVDFAARTAQNLADLALRASHGEIVLPIAQTFPLDEVEEAFVALEGRHAPGKIVVLP